MGVKVALASVYITPGSSQKDIKRFLSISSVSYSATVMHKYSLASIPEKICPFRDALYLQNRCISGQCNTFIRYNSVIGDDR